MLQLPVFSSHMQPPRLFHCFRSSVLLIRISYRPVTYLLPLNALRLARVSSNYCPGALQDSSYASSDVIEMQMNNSVEPWQEREKLVVLQPEWMLRESCTTSPVIQFPPTIFRVLVFSPIGRFANYVRRTNESSPKTAVRRGAMLPHRASQSEQSNNFASSLLDQSFPALWCSVWKAGKC